MTDPENLEAFKCKHFLWHFCYLKCFRLVTIVILQFGTFHASHQGKNRRLFFPSNFLDRWCAWKCSSRSVLKQLLLIVMFTPKFFMYTFAFQLLLRCKCCCLGCLQGCIFWRRTCPTTNVWVITTLVFWYLHSVATRNSVHEFMTFSVHFSLPWEFKHWLQSCLQSCIQLLQCHS